MKFYFMQSDIVDYATLKKQTIPYAVTDPIPENMIEMVKNCIKDFENDK